MSICSSGYPEPAFDYGIASCSKVGKSDTLISIDCIVHADLVDIKLEIRKSSQGRDEQVSAKQAGKGSQISQWMVDG